MWVAPIRLQKKGGGSVSVNNELSLHRNNNENPSMQPAVKGETAVISTIKKNPNLQLTIENSNH